MPYLNALRKTLYGFILALGICQTIISAFSSPFLDVQTSTASTHLATPFQALSSAAAFVTWIWTAVLLSYNNKPRLNHPLTTCLSHFISCGIFSVVWIAIGIMILSQSGYLCPFPDSLDGEGPSFCGLNITTGAVGLVMGLLSCLLTYLIYSTASKTAKTHGHSMGFWESLQKVKLQAQDGFDIPPLAETDQDSKEYPAVTGWRIALYSFVLAFAVFLDVLAPLDAALNSERRFMTIFASIVSVFSLLTWVWTSILLSRLNRPQSSSILTLASVHFYTFVSLTIVWLALGIMLATQTPYECDLESPSDGLASFWCGLAGTNISLSFIEFIFCGITTILLWKTTKNLSGNIGELDGVNSWYEMSKKKQAGATQV